MRMNWDFTLPEKDRHDDPFQSIAATVFTAIIIPLFTWQLWVPTFKLAFWLVSGIIL